jgi:capsular exopolysaccharide synthesis family protein
MTIQGKTPVLESIGSDRANRDEGLPVLGLTDVLRVMRTRKWTIMVTAVVVVAAVALMVSSMTPLYRATSYVMIDPKQSNVTNTNAVVGDLSTDSASIENQVQVLRSRSLAGTVVDKLTLMGAVDLINPPPPEGSTLGEKLDPANLLGPDWFGAEWFKAENWAWLSWDSLKANALALLRTEEAPPAEAPPPGSPDLRNMYIDILLGNLTVTAQGRSTAIALTYQSEVPENAALIANAFANAYVENQVSVKSAVTQNASEWLADRLKELSAQTQASERTVELYKAEKNLTDTSAPGGAPGTTILQQQLSALNLQLINAQSDLAQQEAKYNQMVSLRESGRSADVSQVVASPLISQLRQQEVELTRQEAELSTKYGPLHPRIVDLQSQKENLDGKIDEEVRRVIETVQSDVNVARARVRSLQTSLADLTNRSQGENLSRVKLSELSSAAASNRAVFEAFLSRFKEIEGSDAIQAPDARVISQATLPKSPSFPNKTMFLGAAVPGGLVLGLLLAMLSESLGKGFRTQEQVERILSLPVLAALPEVSGSSRTRRRAADRVINKPMSSFAEAVRGLQLGLVLNGKPPKVVVVTSSVPSEGKTTVAMSLARLAARSLPRVVLLDADLRQPSVVKAMNIAHPKFGLTEALTGTPVEECLFKDPISDVLVLPARRLSNPSDVLASARLAGVIERLSASSDLLVIDSPPLLATNDARILAQFADAVLFVVRWERTSREAAQHALRSLTDAMAPVAGVVFSRADWEQFHYYNYGDRESRELAKYYVD